jgi:hypothetical protein
MDSQQLHVEGVQAKCVVRGPNKIWAMEIDEANKSEVWPVGAAQFDSKPYCNLIVGTITKLALHAMLAPLWSYNI